MLRLATHNPVSFSLDQEREDVTNRSEYFLIILDRNTSIKRMNFNMRTTIKRIILSCVVCNVLMTGGLALSEEMLKLPLVIELKEFSSGMMEGREYAGAVVTLEANDTCKADIVRQFTFALSKDGTKHSIDYIHVISVDTNTSATVSGFSAFKGIEFVLGEKIYKCYSPHSLQALQLVDPESALHISFEKGSKVELVFLFEIDAKTIDRLTVLGKELRTIISVPKETNKE